MIDPRKLFRGLLKMVKGNAEKSYEARNSISVNPTGVKAQFPTVAEYDVIAPDEARSSYKKVMLDPAKGYVDLGNGVSTTHIETPGGYEIEKTRLAKGAMGNDRPINNITFGRPTEDGEISYDRNLAKEPRKPKGSRARFFQKYRENLRRNELKAALGRQLDDIRPGSKLSISAWNSDKGGPARQRYYEMMSNQAILFDPDTDRADTTRLGRNTWQNSEFKNRTFDPKDLKKALKDMGKGYTIRTLLRMAPFARQLPLANALLTGADFGQLMVDTLDKNTSTSGRGGGRSALND